MHITFCCQGAPTESWLQGLRAALPGATVSAWAPGARPADYAVVWAPPQQLIDEQPQLQALFNIGAGVDALMALRLPPQLPVIRLDDAGMAVQMAEYVTQGVVRHFRALDQAEAALRQGHWLQPPTHDRADFPVGIMGLGVLGRRVAQALQLFEFPVYGWSRSPKTLPGATSFHGAQQFGDFLRHSRVLVNLLPLTPETANILNRDTFAQLQPGGYLINVARGAHLVEDDLLAAIAQGQLAGALLDVFRTEPLPADHPLRHEPRITLTPHTSARTLQSATIAQIAGKITALQRGEPITGRVWAERGY